MGTNYYLKSQAGKNIKGLDTPEWHIGKSSAGWVFSLHVDGNIKNLKDIVDILFKEFLKPFGARIHDEYGDKICLDTIVHTIQHREPWVISLEGSDDAYSFWDAKLNLMRHKVGAHCIANGEGTYDLIQGEFS